MANITKAEIEEMIETWESTKNSYFWKFNGNAQERARQEAKYTINKKFEYEGKQCHLICNCSSSRANVYLTKEFTIDGEPKGLRGLKKILSEMTD